jgi:hypothetical protein
MPINSQNPNLGNTFIGQSSTPSPTVGGGRMFPVRVTDISLSSSSNPQSLFQVTKGWSGIGAIRFEPLNEGGLPKEFPQGNIALPLDTNFKKLPLINEIVFIIAGPSVRILEEGNTDAIDFYYINSVSLWNSNHVNALPPLSYNISSTTDNVSVNDVNNGIENNTNDKVEDLSLGKTFQENGRIKNLYPNEGDLIIEGRFGNSIRFGSTAKQPESNKEVQSPWSTEGQNGLPITIIRNGQSKADLDFNNWYPTYEDIQNDDSSIYMASGQVIPVRLGSTNFASFGINAVPITNTTKLLQDTPAQDPSVSNKELDSTGSAYDVVNQEPTRVENNIFNSDVLNEANTLNGNSPLPTNTGINYGEEDSPPIIKVRGTSTDLGFSDEVTRDNNGHIAVPESTNSTVENNNSRVLPLSTSTPPPPSTTTPSTRSGTGGTRIATGSGIVNNPRNTLTEER